MDGEDSIRDGLDAFFGQIVEYTTADRSLGCLLGSVATATDMPAVRVFLKTNLAVTEAQIAERLSTAVRRGQLPSDYPTDQGARRAVNAMLSLGVRARLGSSREELRADAACATATVLGP
jgi:hypothetical protein